MSQMTKILVIFSLGLGEQAGDDGEKNIYRRGWINFYRAGGRGMVYKINICVVYKLLELYSRCVLPEPLTCPACVPGGHETL